MPRRTRGAAAAGPDARFVSAGTSAVAEWRQPVLLPLPQDVGWRLVDGCALLVNRTGGPAYRLNRAATDLWLAQVRAAPQAGGAPPGRVPRIRRIDDMADLAVRIAPAAGPISRPVGEGFAVCGIEGAFAVLHGPAARIWARLAQAPATVVEMLDVLCDEAGLGEPESEAALARILRALDEARLLRGAAPIRRSSPAEPPGRGTGGVHPSREDGIRVRTALAPMQSGTPPPARPSLGAGPVIREAAAGIGHVAIVCQYGIRGLAPGVDAYARRCIAAVAALDPDLVVVSGGGRHGLADVREAESVIERYRLQLPRPALWLEKYSLTTWENLQHSLEMLTVRGVRPSRISLLGDRARSEKLRIAAWVARRRFPAFRRVRFDVVPVPRARSTWRDTRLVQIVAGCAQVLSESRRRPSAIPMDGA